MQREEDRRDGCSPATHNSASDLEATCPAVELARGIKIIKGPGFSAPGSKILLVAEDGGIWLCAAWGYNRIIYRMRAQTPRAGCVALPMGRLYALATSLKPRPRRPTAARATERIELLGEARLSTVTVTRRKGPAQAFLHVAFPHVPMERRIEMEQSDWQEDYELFATTRNRFLMPLQTDLGITFSVSAAWLKACLQRVSFAAQQWYPHRDKTIQDSSPWYGVLLRFAPCREQGREGQQVICLAGDGSQFAVTRQRAFLPFARTLSGQAFHGDIGIPSWTLVELVPLLPERGAIQITRSGPWTAFHLPEAVLVAPLLACPYEIPSLGTDHPVAACAVSAPALLAEIRRVSREIESMGIPWERQRIRIVLSPATRQVKVEPATLGYTSSPVPHTVPVLLPPRGEERSAYLFSRQMEHVLSNIRGVSWRSESGQTASVQGSVLLSLYDPPAPFALAVQPLVSNGYFYATRLLEATEAQGEREYLPPQAESVAPGENLRIMSQMLSDSEGTYYQVENRPTSEHSPYGWCTVEARGGVATECICGGNTMQPCAHMQRLDQILAEPKRGEDGVPRG